MRAKPKKRLLCSEYLRKNAETTGQLRRIFKSNNSCKNEMLEETFIFLPGVMEKTERKLWESGITTWDHLLEATSVSGVSRERLSFWKGRIRQMRATLDTPHGHKVLRQLLGTRHLWRAHKEILDNPRFLDIETTEYCTEITVVGISDGEFYQAFVRGVNLDAYALRRALEGATCLVTFNGSSFDLPMLERVFPNIIPDIPHLDLRHVCAQAGLTGGLKRIEQHLMISRAAAIREKDGVDAVFAWHRHIAGDEDALRELIDYNAADVLNLQPLLKRVLPALWRHIRHQEPLPFTPVPSAYEDSTFK